MAAITLWLILAPLITAYVYHGWMHRPSSIPSRWKLGLVPGDIVSGGVVAGVIIVSFLSLMSFVDFLRLHGQQHDARRGEMEGRVNRRGAANDADHDPVADGDVDYTVLNHLTVHDDDNNERGSGDDTQVENRQRRVRFQEPDEQIRHEIRRILGDFPNEPGARRRELQRRIDAAAELQRHLDRDDDFGEAANADDDHFIWFDPDNDRQPAVNDDVQVLHEVHDREHANERNDDDRDAQVMRDFDRFEPQFEPLDPAIQDDQAVRGT